MYFYHWFPEEKEQAWPAVLFSVEIGKERKKKSNKQTKPHAPKKKAICHMVAAL